MQVQALSFPPFHLDLANEQLWRAEHLIALRPKTFAIFRYLAEHPGRLVTKGELLRAVWGDTQVSEAGLRDYLREIREALSDDPKAPRFVETVHGRGYRFIAPLSAAQLVRSSESGVRSPNLTPNPQSLTPSLVGREAELVQFQTWLEKALDGERQIVFVTGEPGIGKTALVETFLAQIGAGSRACPPPGHPQGVPLRNYQTCGLAGDNASSITAQGKPICQC
jgi:DNA-binding winged helix-turn-helix (wHTH) protein